MSNGSAPLDRLLPRHEPHSGVTVGWNVREERQGLRKETVSDSARIVDLSLEGALLDVPAGPPCEVDQTIHLRLENTVGRAQIRHREDGEGKGEYRYGVRFLHDHEFIEVVRGMVGEIRDEHGRLAAAWKHAR